MSGSKVPVQHQATVPSAGPVAGIRRQELLRRLKYAPRQSRKELARYLVRLSKAA